MIKTVHYSSKFKKDLKRIKNENDRNELKVIIKKLKQQKDLPAKNKDHQLKGNYSSHRECHVKPDLLLIYKIENDKLILVRTGAHSELFR